jgi:hypothetical protein
MQTHLNVLMVIEEVDINVKSRMMYQSLRTLT